MSNKEIWARFIGSNFFRHIRYDVETGWTADTIHEFLILVESELRQNGIIFNPEDPELELPDTEIEREAIGFNVERIKERLRSAAEDGGATEPWIRKYLDDTVFSSYVDGLLDFLSQKARYSLPSLETSVDPKQQREEDYQRDYSEDAKHFADEAKKAQEAAEKTERSALDAKDAALSAQKAAESIVPNMLTTLGVFVAIIVAVVAAYLSLLLGQHINETKPLNLAICLLMGHILLNVIFLLLYLISKMLHRSVACNCSVANDMDCSTCDESYRERCHFGNKVWLRYPYVVLLNGVFILAYFILFLWHVVKTYVAITIHKWLVLLLLCLLVVGFIAILPMVIKCVRWKGEEKTVKEKTGIKQKLKDCLEKRQKRRKEKKDATRKQIRKLETNIEELRKEIRVLQDKVQGLPNKGEDILEPEEEFDGRH